MDLKRYVDSFSRYLELIEVRKDDNVAVLMGNSKDLPLKSLG